MAFIIFIDNGYLNGWDQHSKKEGVHERTSVVANREKYGCMYILLLLACTPEALHSTCTVVALPST